jgi:L-alanine-DL-glutamate epimerase-like enolase superfamily enzyme
MRITDVQAFPVQIPFRRPFGVKRGSSPTSDHVLVRVVTDDGVAGWGEAAPNPLYSEERMETVLTMARGPIKQVIAGRDPLERELLLRDLDEALMGNSFAKAALDEALHDLVATQLGIPVAQLLGGIVRELIPLAMPLGIGDVATTVADAEAFVAAGFATLKLKVGRDPSADLERLRAVRNAVGPGVKLRVDANQGFSEGDLPILRAMEAVGLEYIEQPLPRWNVRGMSRVAKALDVPIMADESAFTEQDVLELIDHGAADGVIIKVAKSGFSHAQGIATVASAAGMLVEVSEMGASSVGLAAGVHFAASLRTLSYACEIIAPMLYERMPWDKTKLLSEVAGWRVPRLPGLGVSVDQRSLPLEPDGIQ